jgi:hypothetical protein
MSERDDAFFIAALGQRAAQLRAKCSPRRASAYEQVRDLIAGTGLETALASLRTEIATGKSSPGPLEVYAFLSAQLRPRRPD